MKPSLVLIGLGNPGANYSATRHNAGFRAIDALSAACGEGEWYPKQKFVSQMQEGRVGVVPILLVKPQTYMNLSADSVRKIVDFYRIDPATQIIVFCDDVDLPLGTVRFRMTGGPGTHNGLRSLADVYGENYPRMRIGIGPSEKPADLATWVLSAFTEEEAAAVDAACAKLPDKIRAFVMESDAHTA